MFPGTRIPWGALKKYWCLSSFLPSQFQFNWSGATWASGFFKAPQVVLTGIKVRTTALYSSLGTTLTLYLLFVDYHFYTCSMFPTQIYFYTSALFPRYFLAQNKYSVNMCCCCCCWKWWFNWSGSGRHRYFLKSASCDSIVPSWTPLGWLLQLQLMVAMEKFGWRSAKRFHFSKDLKLRIFIMCCQQT